MSAQNRGDKYIAGTIGTSFGSQYNKIFDGAYSTTHEKPLELSFITQAEFGLFVADNIRLALAIGVPFTSSPTTQSGDTWLKTNTVGFQINPNIAYYAKLADRFYYTPEIGGAVEFGSYKEEMTANSSYNAYTFGWDIYAHLLAFEFRINPKIALGMLVGSISYIHTKIGNKGTYSYLTGEQFNFNLNNSSVHIRFYF